MKRIAGIALTFLTVTFLGAEAKGSFTFLLPPDNALVSSRQIHAIGSFDGNAEAVLIQLNQGKSDTMKTGDMPMFHDDLKLSPGWNRIIFTAFDKGTAVGQESLRVFYAVGRGDEKIPAGVKKYNVHDPDLPKPCQDCHDLKITEKAESPAKPEDSPCYTCHIWHFKGGIVHAPVVAFQCSSCHDFKNATKRFKLLAEGGELCYTCHGDKKKEVETTKNPHPPAAAGSCLECHDPHRSTYTGRLYASVNTVCRACHTEKRFEDHPVSGHPTSDQLDPSRPGKQLSCISCHNPHGSDHQKLFYRVDRMQQLCTECHNKM